MDTSKIKAYAIQARRDFLQAVTEKANAYGIFADDHIEPMEIKGDMAIIGERAFPKKEGELRNKIVDRVKRISFEMVMRSCAYTWFNRFVAIRYMEVHDYLQHGFRVLSNRNGSRMPEILENAADLEFEGLDKDTVIELKLAGTKDNELYRLLILSQCNDLHRAMPFLFDRIDNEMELLLPDNLLHTDSPVQKLVTEIDEADWNDVEIIGWIYQFYISERKDEVIGKVVKSEDIPAATQLFTPNWIVKYMVQNTLGRMWLATYPESQLREKMEFYIEPAEQEPEVQDQLDAITPEELNPEEITFLDPACGSGHILVEAYDVFKEIYLERGYRTRDIPRLILGKNIFGLDICDRAAQLASFAVLMKAREDDRRILGRDDLNLNVMAIQESMPSDKRNIELFFNGDEYQEIRKDLNQIASLFERGKTFGALLLIPDHLGERVSEIEAVVEKKIGAWGKGSDVRNLLALVKQARLLACRYDCVVTNPPYMGNKFFVPKLKAFSNKSYKHGKSDLYGCFILNNINQCKQSGYVGMITIPNWMFLSSFKDLRSKLISSCYITSFIHNGRGVWGSDFGSCAFVFRIGFISGYRGTFKKLFDKQGSVNHNNELKKRFFKKEEKYASGIDFKIIPGIPIAYWATEAVRKTYEKAILINQIAPPKTGMSTGFAEKCIFMWPEINWDKFTANSNILDERYRFYPHNKGGGFRKWYGNCLYVLKYSNVDIKRMENYPGFRHDNSKLYFLESVSWGKVTISKFSARYYPDGYTFDNAAVSLFSDNLLCLLAFLNSIVFEYFVNILGGTLNYTVGDIGRVPVTNRLFQKHRIHKELLELSKSDWDSYETSWDFNTIQLLKSEHQNTLLKKSYSSLRNHCNSILFKMKNLEEENNEFFIDIYDLKDDLISDVALSEITLTCNPHYRYGVNKTNEELESLLQTDTIKELISYAIGCMMGRYSLDHPGLIYAHSSNIDFDPTKYKTFPADDDGIIPILDQDWFPDDATNRFVDFLKVAWPPETLQENLKFVADSLKSKRNETPVDTIRRYLSTGFFKDHLKTYKKRPIYWLFSSGKQRAFECLVYLHRYNETTLSRMRSSYVTPLQSNIRTRLEFLDAEKDAATTTSAKNKVNKEINKLKKKQVELSNFDDELRHFAEMKISLDLDDGVKVNYGKFGSLLAEKKTVTGKK